MGLAVQLQSNSYISPFTSLLLEREIVKNGRDGIVSGESRWMEATSDGRRMGTEGAIGAELAAVLSLL